MLWSIKITLEPNFDDYPKYKMYGISNYIYHKHKTIHGR